MSPFDRLLSAQGFEPHGYCLLWNRWLISLHVVSDLVTGLSYLAIAATMVYLLHRARRNLPFAPIFVAFAVFILACGATHFVDVYTLWVPRYWVQGSVKALTAVASLVTAIAFPFFVPAVLRTIAAAHAQREAGTRLRAMFEGLFDGVVLLEPVRDAAGAIEELTICEVNPPATLILGQPREALIGRGLCATFPHIRANGSYAGWVGVAETGVPLDEELVVPMAVEGSSAEWVHRRSVRVDDGVLVVIRDVTRRRRREAALGESEARYRALFHESGAMQWIVDAEREQIVDANAAAAAFYGYSCEELRGMPLGQINTLPTADLTALIGRTAQGEVPLMVVSHRLASGEDREIEVRPSPVVIAGRLCTHTVMHDVTARRRAERELRESERRFSAAFDYAAHGIALVAADGRFVKVNKQLCVLTGYTEHEFLMRTFQEITHPDDLDADVAQAEQLLAGDVRSYQMEKRYVRRDGTTVWILLAASLVRDEAGAPLHFIAQIEDLTARKEAERSARERESLYRTLARHFPRGAVVLFDQHLRMLLVDGQGLADVGLDRRHMEGRTIWENFDEATCAIIEPIYRAALAGESTIAEVPYGGRVYLQHSSPVPSSTGTVSYGLVVTQDITERSAMERRLQASAAALELKSVELERSNQDLERFAYVASHDLQEPLRMVISYTTLLAERYRGRLDERADTFIHFAVDGAARMRQLIQDLLTFSRVSSGDTFSRVDLEPVLRNVLADLGPLVADADGAVTHEPLPTICGDATQLRQLVQNLIGNALKYRRPGVRPRIHVRSVREGAHWHLTVTDNGIGIAPEFAERVFVIFQRLHTREAYPGTGLGLALCKRIVHRHEGRIWVEPAPGGGSVFHVLLSAALDSPTESRADDPFGGALQDATSAAAGPIGAVPA